MSLALQIVPCVSEVIISLCTKELNELHRWTFSWRKINHRPSLWGSTVWARTHGSPFWLFRIVEPCSTIKQVSSSQTAVMFRQCASQRTRSPGFSMNRSTSASVQGQAEAMNWPEETRGRCKMLSDSACSLVTGWFFHQTSTLLYTLPSLTRKHKGLMMESLGLLHAAAGCHSKTLNPSPLTLYLNPFIYYIPKFLFFAFPHLSASSVNLVILFLVGLKGRACFRWSDYSKECLDALATYLTNYVRRFLWVSETINLTRCGKESRKSLDSLQLTFFILHTITKFFHLEINATHREPLSRNFLKVWRYYQNFSDAAVFLSHFWVWSCWTSINTFAFKCAQLKHCTNFYCQAYP